MELSRKGGREERMKGGKNEGRKEGKGEKTGRKGERYARRNGGKENGRDRGKNGGVVRYLFEKKVGRNEALEERTLWNQ